MIYFETKRLVYRDWENKDLKELRIMNKDSRVMEYFPCILTENETNNFYKKIKSEIRNLGYGLYAVELKRNSEFIGFIGFHKANFEADFTPCIEISWRLKYKAWKKGYATEGAKACLQYGFNNFNFKKVYSFTAKVNTRSENVMRNIGMTKIREFNHPRVDKNSFLSKHVLYFSSN